MRFLLLPRPYAPERLPDCQLEFVGPDITHVSASGSWASALLARGVLCPPRAVCLPSFATRTEYVFRPCSD
eukprot:11211105-Lingulodinium_polyedra.AAC.1